ncbi:MAG: DAK2 domain-containing protein [Actinomycetota bacterium]
MRAAAATEIQIVLRHFVTSLVDAEEELNAINVFPVPDGDTGTNLRRTAEAMLGELDAADPAAAPSQTVAMAALNAARGNSGLICAQYLSGLFTDPAQLFVDGETMARGLATAARRARAAVAEPVEGTMVSVADVTARAAADWLTGPDHGDATTAADLLAEVHGVARRAVEDTRGQLPVLAEAGVIDAGAAGLLLLIEALAAAAVTAAGGVELDAVATGEPATAAASGLSHAGPPGLAVPLNDHAGALDALDGEVLAGGRLVGFELQFTADGDDAVADELRRLLVGHGDSVVVSQAEGLIRAHVHTDAAVGGCVEAVLDVVRPRNIDIEPLIERVRP